MSNAHRLTRLIAMLVLTLIFVWLFSNTSATATPHLVQCSPVPTPETLTVEPVTSPTTLLTQTLRVRLNNSRRVTVTSEAGATIFFTTSPSTFISPIPLLPNVTHHVVVTGLVEYQGTGCTYTYTRSTTVDKNGAALTIIQLGRRVYLPIILKQR
jgi:hypothetical protein